MSTSGPIQPDILIISYSRLERDARVLRQIQVLHGRYRIVTAGLSHPGILVLDHHDLSTNGLHLKFPYLLRKFISLWIKVRRYFIRRIMRDPICEMRTGHYARDRRKLGHLRPRLVIANDIEALPLAIGFKRHGARILFDAHEYSPGQHDADPKWVERHQWRIEYLLKHLMRKADACCTVSDPIAKAYEELTGVLPSVITNAPAYFALTPMPIGDRIKVVHHGILVAERRIAELIEMMDELRGTHELYLHGHHSYDPRYWELIGRMCEQRPHVHLLPAIPPEQIVPTINRYDIGIHHLHAESFNHRYALPNKFFEFVQARLAMVIGPNPEMARLARLHRLGIVTTDHKMSSFLQALKLLSPKDIMSFKGNAHTAALALSSGPNERKLEQIVDRLIGSDPIHP